MIAYRQLLEHFAARALEEEAEEVLEEADWSTSDPVELTLRAESERLEALLRRLEELSKPPQPRSAPIRVSAVTGGISPDQPLIVRPALPAGFRPPTPSEAAGPGVASVYRPAHRREYLPALPSPPRCNLPVRWSDRPQRFESLLRQALRPSEPRGHGSETVMVRRDSGGTETRAPGDAVTTAASIHPGLANLLAVVGIMLGLAGVALLVSELLYWM